MSSVAGPPFDWRSLFGDTLQYGLPIQPGLKEEGERAREKEKEKEAESPGEYIQWPDSNPGDNNEDASKGSSSLGRGQRVDTMMALSAKYVGIYFSGHW